MSPPTGDEMAERGTDRYMSSHGAQAPPRAPVVEIPPGPSFEGSVGARIHELTVLLAKIWTGDPITQKEISWLNENGRVYKSWWRSQ